MVSIFKNFKARMIRKYILHRYPQLKTKNFLCNPLNYNDYIIRIITNYSKVIDNQQFYLSCSMKLVWGTNTRNEIYYTFEKAEWTTPYVPNRSKFDIKPYVYTVLPYEIKSTACQTLLDNLKILYINKRTTTKALYCLGLLRIGYSKYYKYIIKPLDSSSV